MASKWQKKIATARHLIERGDYRALGERVVGNVLRVFGAFDPSSPKFYARFAERDRRAPPPVHSRETVSILTPVFNVKSELLDACVQSVLRQSYPHVELILVDDCSTAPHIRPQLDAIRDPRVKTIFLPQNRGIAGATQAALEAASGGLVGLLDNDDELEPDALAWMIAAVEAQPEAEWFYSDFVLRLPNGKLAQPFFKPDWSPERLMNGMYTNHFQLVRKGLLQRAGGFRSGFDGAQDFDLALRMMEHTTRVVHVPRVLYRWRVIPGSTSDDYNAKPYANEAAKRALRQALCRRGLAIPTDRGDGRDGCDVHVDDGRAPGTFRVDYKLGRGGALGPAPKVSILIPFRDGWSVTQRALDSIVARSSYRNYEILLIDNGSRLAETRDGVEHFVEHHRNVLCLRDDRPFNHSALNNLAAKHATGEVLLILNNDVEVETPDWLERMLMHVQVRGVGAVGCLLLYPNRTIQHAGVILGIQGVAGHAYRGHSEAQLGYYGSVYGISNMSAVTGACLMIRKSVFDEVGGFDAETFPTSYNDVDLCLRLRQRGYRNVYTGHARLLHYESYSRGKDKDDSHRRRMQTRWGPMLRTDPYFSPSFSLAWEDYRFGV